MVRVLLEIQWRNLLLEVGCHDDYTEISLKWNEEVDEDLSPAPVCMTVRVRVCTRFKWQKVSGRRFMMLLIELVAFKTNKMPPYT